MSSAKRIDIAAVCEIAVVEKEARYPVAPLLRAMRDKSEYLGGKQPNGYLAGTPAALARAVECKSETVSRIHERLLALDEGGNDTLRALPSENSEELIFYSERMKNTLDAMSEKKGVRLAAREARAAARREASAKNKASESSAEASADDAAGTDTPPPALNPDAAPPADSVEAKRERLRRLENSLSMYGNAMAASDIAEAEKKIQQLKTDLNISDADNAENGESREADGAGSAGTDESEERAAPKVNAAP